MQTLIKVSNRIKWYFVKFIIWLTSPITLFKNYLTLFERLEHRVHKLEGVNDFSDIEQRLEDLEYYDLYDIQERAENAERKASDNENLIDSVKERSETNQESIKHIKDRLNTLESDKENLFVAGTLDTIDDLGDRVDNLEELAKKYLNAELQAVVSKQERTEESLSAMQKLSFEICMKIFGDFNLDDFNNCYDIINKYDVKEGK